MLEKEGSRQNSRSPTCFRYVLTPLLNNTLQLHLWEMEQFLGKDEYQRVEAIALKQLS